MNIKIALVGFEKNQYKTPHIAASTLGKSVKKYGYPIKVIRRGDEVYFVRTDM